MDQHFRRYENSQVLSFIFGIAKRLEFAANTGMLGIGQSRLRTPWKIHIFESPTPNAFSAGAGNLILTKSLIQSCESEAELASILAHEMSHYYLAHSEESSSYSIDREIEADTLAFSLTELAGYPLQANISALNLLYRQGAENVSEENQKNLDLRTENLMGRLKGKNNWGFDNSREFKRIQKVLTLP